MADIFRREALAHQIAARTPEPLAPLAIVTGARAAGWVVTVAAAAGLMLVSSLRVPCVAAGVLLGPLQAGERFDVTVLASSDWPRSFGAAVARADGACTATLGRERVAVSLRYATGPQAAGREIAMTGRATGSVAAGAPVSLECGAESLAAALTGRQ